MEGQSKAACSLGGEAQEHKCRNVRRILRCKRTLLQEMAEEIDWPDRKFFAELRDGFRLVGCLRPSGIFRPGFC